MAIEKLSTDLVIIGAGGAGLPAALAAQENGIEDVILLEKRFATGGEAQYAGGMIFATGTRHQKEKGWYLSADDKFQKAMEFCHYDIVKPEIMRAYIDKTATNIDWIEETSGVEYECVTGPCQLHQSMDNTTHVPVGLNRPTMTFSQVTLQWVKRFKANGGRVLVNTDGMSIIKDSNKAVGVMARTRDGRDIEISAKAVIIATGNFARNAALMHQRFPDRYPESSNPVDQRGQFCDYFGEAQTGDGVVMSDEADVAISERSILCRETGFCFGVRGHNANLPYRASHAAPCIWVNKYGERFHEKSMSHDNTASNAVYSQPEHAGYALYDDEMLEKFENDTERVNLPGKEFPTRAPIVSEFEKGNPEVFIGDDWDKVAAYIGANPATLKATIEEYNSYCDKGHDDLFNKDKKNLWALRKPPFYVLRFVDNGQGMPYGILETTKYMEALDTKHEVIPGLYIAGVLVAGFSGWDYHMFGTGLGFSLSSGRIAGESAAKYIKEIMAQD